ncbi:WD40-repeat-containing domain protein [Zopfochytrium polystomum]|nr:WD40-repeat-containing domain protein [Zopfochytrium polystomum]
MPPAAHQPKRWKRPDGRGQPPVHLDRVLGLNVTRPTCLAVHPVESEALVAYAAGCMVVLYNHRLNRQTGYLIAAVAGPAAGTRLPAEDLRATPGALAMGAVGSAGVGSGGIRKAAGSVKPVSCLAFSPDGRYLAVGEAGHQPKITVWDHATATIASEFSGHKFGVHAVQFSPNAKYLVSVGLQHDANIYVWNWASGQKLSQNRASSLVHAVQFESGGRYFATAGAQHFWLWNMEVGKLTKPPSYSAPTRTALPQLDGERAILGDHKNETFVDIALFCVSEEIRQIYSITERGVLVCFDSEYVMEKWVDLKVEAGRCIALCERFIVCGCAQGVVRLFEPITMKHLQTLPRPHPIGFDVSSAVGSRLKTSQAPGEAYPSVVAIKVNSKGDRIIAVYDDHSLYIWDVEDLRHIGKYRSFLYHSDSIWGVEAVPFLSEPHPDMPRNTFITCSSDSTIRFWSSDSVPSSTPTSPESAHGLHSNLYSRELMKVIHVNDKSATQEASGSTEANGVKSIRVSPDASLLAAGDRFGNLRVYDLDNFSQRVFLEAHDAEILSMDFTYASLGPSRSQLLLSTASRDRLIHVFDVERQCQLVQTLEDHTASVTAVRFSDNGRRLISAAADKSVMFRQSQDGDGFPEYTSYHSSIGRSTIYDIAVDPLQKSVATVSQDRRLNIYSIQSGKPIYSFRPDPVDDPSLDGVTSGSLTKVCIDPSGRFAATAGSDKCIRIFDLSTGVVISRLVGHSEAITGLAFTPDMTILISCGADSLVLLWKLSPLLRAGLKTPKGIAGPSVNADQTTVESFFDDDVDSMSSAIYEKERLPDSVQTVSDAIRDFMSGFRDEDLPAWARRSRLPLGQIPTTSRPKEMLPKRGLWADRVEDVTVKLYSEVPGESTPVASGANLFERRYSIESMAASRGEAETGGPSEDDENWAAPSEGILSVASARAEVANSENDLILDEFSDTKSATGESGEEATVFFDSSDSTGDLEDMVSQFTVLETEEIVRRPADSVTDSQEGLSARLMLDLSSASSTPEPNSARVTPPLEEYLLLPVDRDAVRQSISAKHLATRGHTLISAFEAVKNSTPLSEVTIREKPDESIQDHRRILEDVNKTPTRKRILSVSPSLPTAENIEGNDAVPLEQLDSHSREESSPQSDQAVGSPPHTDDSNFVDPAKCLQDLRELKRLSAVSTSTLLRIESKGDSAPEEEALVAAEIRSVLQEVQAAAEKALNMFNPKQEESGSVDLLEKYSEQLVKLVREKLMSGKGEGEHA